MNTDNLILRETDNLPLINKEDTLLSSEIDGNFINIYNDFLDLSIANDSTLIYDIEKSYAIGEYTTYDGRMWVSIEVSTGSTPSTDSLDWLDVFPTILAHEKNKDTILDEGGTNETTVAEIRAFIDAGLTSTTNLSLTTKTATSFKIESSTGADVTIPQATISEAGLLNATDKLKIKNLTGINTGDQTLVSLNAEDLDNKAIDFTTINDTLYPTTQAVDTYITAVVPDLVDTFVSGLVAQDLQDVTTEGNTTTDNIAFTGAVGVLFDNTSTLRKGTIDAGYGGAKGIAQICSVGYELKWEAGRLYVMGDGGTTIREVSHNFTTTPSATDDNTKGFIVGSRWILDDGSLYICTDVTTATAVWVLQTIDAIPTDGSTKAVSSNGVFDALADKVDKVVGSRLITSAESTLLGNTSGTNTGDQTISDATITTTDITTNNFTTAKHGFVPKGTNTGKFLKDDGTWGTPSAGGLTYFTEAQSTSSPNATVNVDSLTAVAGTTDADFVIKPKGTGAILRDIPDGTTTGGNKRGIYAVDFQSDRFASNRVASGDYSILLGGQYNTAAGSYSSNKGGQSNSTSGSYSSIGGGAAGLASGSYSAINGGQTNNSTGNWSSIGGGLGNTASSTYSTVVGGNNNTSSGSYDVSGGYNNNTSGVGAFAFGGNNIASSNYSVALNNSNTASGAYAAAINYLNTANGIGSFISGGVGSTFGVQSRRTLSGYGHSSGSAQLSDLVLSARTTGVTATTVVVDHLSSASPAASNQLVLSNQSAFRIKGSIIGKKSGTTDVAAWDIDMVIVRGANAAATSVVVSNVNVVTNIPSWGTPTITANTTLGCPTIQVIGLAATNISWSVNLNSIETIYA